MADEWAYHRLHMPCDGIHQIVRSEFGYKEMVGVLTRGSNASPNRLGKKLAKAPFASALALSIRLSDYILVYAGTTSYHRSILATFECSPGK